MGNWFTRKMSEARHAATHAVSSVTHTVSDAVTSTSNVVNDVKHAVSETVTGAQIIASEKIASTTKAVNSTVNDVKHAVSETVTSAQVAVAQKVVSSTQAVLETADKVSQAVETTGKTINAVANSVDNAITDTINIGRGMAGYNPMGADQAVSADPEARKAEMERLKATSARMEKVVQAADVYESVAKPIDETLTAIDRAADTAIKETYKAGEDVYTLTTGRGTATELREAFERTESRLNRAEAALTPIVEAEKRAVVAVEHAGQDLGTMIDYGVATYTGNTERQALLEQAAIDATNRTEGRIKPVQEAIVSTTQDAATIAEFSWANATGDQETASRLAGATISAADRSSNRIVATAQALPLGDTLSSGTAYLTDASGLTSGNYENLTEHGGNKTVQAVQHIAQGHGKFEDVMQVGTEALAVIPGGKAAKVEGMATKEAVALTEQATARTVVHAAEHSTIATAEHAAGDIVQHAAKESVIKTTEKVIVSAIHGEGKKHIKGEMKREAFKVTDDVLVATTGKDTKAHTAEIKEGAKERLAEVKTAVASLVGSKPIPTTTLPAAEPAALGMPETLMASAAPSGPAAPVPSAATELRESMTPAQANALNAGLSVAFAGMDQAALLQIQAIGQALKQSAVGITADVSDRVRPTQVAAIMPNNNERSV